MNYKSKYFKSVGVILTAIPLLILSGCSSDKDSLGVVTSLDEQAYKDYENHLKENKNVEKQDVSVILGEEFKSYEDVKQILVKNKLLTNDNILEKFLKTAIFSSYQNTVNKNDLNNTLIQTKTNLEKLNKKYTEEIKNEVTFEYILKKGRLDLFDVFLKPTTVDIGEFAVSNNAVQIVSYEVDEKEMKKMKKTKEDILEEFKKNTEKINTIDDVKKVGINYSVYNYSKANPLVDKKDYEFIEENKKDKYMVLNHEDGVTEFIKVIDTKPLAINEKSAIISLLKFEQLAKQEEPEYLAINLLKTIDANSDDIYLTDDVYKELTKEIKNLSKKEKEEFLDIFRKIYVDNYVVIY